MSGPLGTAARRSQLLAAVLVAAWLVTLVAGLHLAGLLNPPAVIALVLLRTLLQTGLFIVGHDAMHRLLVPDDGVFNDRLGALVLALYAGLPYGLCRRQHLLHHRHPGERADPDCHQGGSAPVLAWYARFMGRYLNPLQMGCLLLGWGGLAWVSSIQAVLLVCTLPLLLSSLQLFVVGTYLPHRRTAGAHQAVATLDLPEWLSLLACFHFGYHREHHRAPHLAWHQLPALRRDPDAVAFATADFPQ